MNVSNITEQQFNEFVLTYNDKSIYQTSNYALVMEKQGFKYFYIGFFNNSNLIGASLIIYKKINGSTKAYAPRGFLLDYTNPFLKTYLDLAKKHLSKQNINTLRISPLLNKNTDSYAYSFNVLNNSFYKHIGYNDFFESLKPRFIANIDISEHYTLLFNNIKKEYRTKIRKAVRNGIKVYKGNINDIDKLYYHTKQKYPRDKSYFEDILHHFDAEIYYTSLNTLEHLNKSKKLFDKQSELCDSLNHKILNLDTKKNKDLIKKKILNDNLLNTYNKQLRNAIELDKLDIDNIITSSCLIIKYQKEIYLLMDGYDKNYKYFNSKHLLIWKLIEKFSKLGYTHFNLGGIANPNSDSKYKGLNDFKLNFGADIIEYAGDFQLLTNNLQFVLKNPNEILNVLKK